MVEKIINSPKQYENPKSKEEDSLLVKSETSVDLQSTWSVAKVDESMMDYYINLTALLTIVVLAFIKLTLPEVNHWNALSFKEFIILIFQDNFNAYLNHVNKNPLLYKAMTSFTVYTIGDLMSQRIYLSHIG